MIAEYFWNKWVKGRVVYSFYLGIFITLISFIFSRLIFMSVHKFIGISTVMLAVTLSLPLFNVIITRLEQSENKKMHFFKRYEPVLDFYLYFFLGVFLTFFIISLIMPQMVFAKDDFYPSQPQQSQLNLTGIPPPIIKPVSSVFINNVIVMSVCFILSIFFGCGSLFLIILNASMAAAALSKFVMLKFFFPVSEFVISTICNTNVYFVHLIPEIGAYIIAAISGGVLSKAIFTKSTKKIKIKAIKDSIKWFIISIAILYAGAFLEMNVTRKLFETGVCYTQLTIPIIMCFVILGIVLFELVRKEKIKLVR